MKLMRASMLYIILFAFGIVAFVNNYYNYPAQSALDKASGKYTSSTVVDPKRPSNYIKELDKFSTLKTDDEANLASCGSTILKTNYNQQDKYNASPISAPPPRGNSSSDPYCATDACKEAAKNADMGGWLRLQLCQNRDNKNIGCIPDYYTSGEVDVITVKEFPMLEFLSSTKAAEVAGGTEMGSSTASNNGVAGISDGGMSLTKFTQPICMYNIFRNIEAQTETNTALSFVTDYKGPIYFNGLPSSCSAVIPYVKLGNASSCWGVTWDDYIRDAKFDVKSFYKEYWDLSTGGGYQQPDTWWGKFLEYIKNAITGPNLASNIYLDKVSSFPEIGAKEVCKELPGGGITKFNSIATIKSTDEYEVTRMLHQYNQNDTCSMQFLRDPKTALVRGIKSCQFNDAANTIFFEAKLNDIIVKQKTFRNYSICLEHKDNDPNKPCIRWYEWIECDPPKTICGTEYKCEKDSGSVYRYRDAFKACLETNDVVDIDPKDEFQGINFRVAKDPFPELLLSNGSRLLRYTYDLEQLAAHNPIKYGDNIGIKLKVQRSLYDMNWCQGGVCTYGQKLLNKPSELSFDPVQGLQTGLINEISLDKATPYNVLYKPGSHDLLPASTYDQVSEKKVASQSELYYYYPYVGNLTIMLERVSVLLTNQSNNDTGSLLIGWMYGKNPFPAFNNPKIETILINACKDTPQYDIAGDKKDCFLNDDNGLDWKGLDLTNPNIPCGDGIDVSHWNGDIDWSAVAGDKIGYAIIKASEGVTFVDSQFSKNWNNSKGKVKRTAYHFFRPEIDGALQAIHFLKVVEEAGGGQDFTLALDVEKPCNMQGTSCVPYSFDRQASQDNIKKFLDKIKSVTGQAPMIYTSKYMWESVMTTGSVPWPVNEYPLWIAIYASGPGTMPSGWNDYAIWQYSSSGTVAGISGRVDMNKTNPNTSWLPKSQCPTSTTTGTTGNTTVAGASTSQVLGIGANRLTDIDSFKTYLKNNIITAKTTNLCVGQSIGGSNGGDDDVNITYFPPGPTDVPDPTPTSGPTPTTGPSPTPYIINGDCPFVQTDMTSPGTRCTQGPYGDWSHSCNDRSPGYYAIDMGHQGYGVAPEAGIVRWYPEGPDTGAGTCTRCAGKCLNTIKLTTSSGRIYVFTHMVLSGVNNLQPVKKGQVIGVTKWTDLEKNSGCSDGVHLDFSIIENGVRIPQIKQIYEQLCSVSLNCINDNKCK